MIYLILSVIASTLIIITFRLFERFRISKMPAITINYLAASLLGYLSACKTVNFASFPAKSWFIPAIIAGFTLIVGFNFFAMSARYAGVAVTGIASRMSVIIPVILGFTLFGDLASPLKITGIALALIAFYLTTKKNEKIKINKKQFWIPTLLFFAIGLNDSVLKISQHYFINGEFIQFLATAFAFALIIGLAVLLLANQNFLHTFSLNNVMAGIILGVLNWFSTYYFLRGMEALPVTVIVPVINVSIVALSAITGALFFGEKLSATNWAGIAVAMMAIILIAGGL